MRQLFSAIQAEKVRRFMISSLTMIAVILLSLYLGVVLAMFGLQRKLLYLPNDAPAYPKSHGLQGIDLIRLATPDGENLVAWYRPAQEEHKIILYFHGNAGNLSDRTDKYRALTDKGFGLLALSYRGYGGSSGTPTEEGFYTDARAAMQYLLSQSFAPSDIVLFGESLGTGVAVQMATEYPVAALVLEAPYTSVANRAQEIYPYIPAKWLLRDRFDSIAKIGGVRAPLLIFHGEKDPTIPPVHGRALLAAANEPKQGIFYADVGHTEFDIPLLAEETYRFVARHAATP